MILKKILAATVFCFFSFLSMAQSPVWATRMGGSNAELSYFASAVDQLGNTYVMGTFSGTATFGVYSLSANGGKDNFLAKIDCGGSIVWVEKIGSSADEGDWGSVTVDKNNNIYVTGSHSNSCTFYSSNASNQTISSAGGQDLYLAKYTPLGVLTWAINAGGGTGKENSFCVKTDNLNDVIITGYYGYNGVSCTFGGTSYSCAGVYDLFVEKFTPGGVFQWVRTAGSFGDDIGVAVEVDTNNNIYVTGQHWSTMTIGGTAFTVGHAAAAGWDACIIKFDASGNYKWSELFSGNLYDGANMIAYSNGKIYVTGCYQGSAFTLYSANASNQTIASAGGYDMYLAQYDTLGNLNWVDHFGAGGDDIARSVVVNGTKVIWTGNYNNAFSVGTGSLSSIGASDVFVITTNTGGTVLSAQSFGGTQADEAWCIAKDKYSNLYLSGTFLGTCNFGTKSVTSSGSTDVFVTKIAAQNNIQTFLPADTQVCAGTLFTITPLITSSYYLWNNNATTQSIAVSSTGYYKLKTVLFCDTVYDSIYVFFYPLVTVATSNDTSVCGTNTKTLSATGTATRFLWSTGDTTGTISVSPATTTTYWVRGQIGVTPCFAYDTVKITVNPVPFIITANDTTVCSGTSKQLTTLGTANRYLWSSGDTSATITVTPAATTTYWVRGQIGTANCFVYDSVKITVNPLPSIATNQDTTLCSGTVKTLTATGTATRYLWSTGDTTATISVSPSVTTSYWVRGQIGTASCFAFDTVKITVNPLPGIATNQDTTLCNGTIKTLGTSGTATRYLWSTGDTTATITVTPTATTTYWVRGQIGTASCFAYDTVTITVITCATNCINCTDTLLLAAKGLQVCMPFNGNASDESNHGNNGTVTNALLTADRNNAPLKAYQFNGINSEISIANNPLIDFNSSSTFTISFWHYASAASNFSSIITKSEQSDTSGYVVGFDNTGKFRFMTNLLYEVKTTGTVPLNTWQHYTVTFNTKNQVRVYVNGLMQASTAIPNLNGNAYPVKLGRLYTTTSGYFYNGKIDELRIYNRALSPAEVEKLFNVSALAVSAGNDRTICKGDTITLKAQGGNTYSWQPIAGLSNPSIANPLAFPTVSTDYICTISNGTCTSNDTVHVEVNQNCLGCPSNMPTMGAELVVNGDFENGNTGFGTDLTYRTLFSNQGDYGVTYDPNLLLYTLSSCGDRTSGNGKMLVIDASVTAGKRVWYQTVPVNPKSIYTFSFWASSVYSLLPAQLQFRINGVVLGTTLNLPSNTCGWLQSGISWASGTSTSALLEIIDINTVAIGNDFALDHISFKECGCDVVPFISKDTAICKGNAVTLTASGGIVYRWRPAYNINDTIIPNPTVTPDTTTTYTVYITGISGCEKTDSVKITVNPKPSVGISADMEICEGESATLHASGGVTYRWNPDISLNDTTSSDPVVTPKTNTRYFVTVSNASGCKDTAGVSVRVKSCEDTIFLVIPNVFTINNDGTNDNFEVGSKGIRQFSITIYNRWGQELYASDDVHFKWNGGNYGEGVYYYKVIYSTSKEQSKTLKGSITLIRN